MASMARRLGLILYLTMYQLVGLGKRSENEADNSSYCLGLLSRSQWIISTLPDASPTMPVCNLLCMLWTSFYFGCSGIPSATVSLHVLFFPLFRMFFSHAFSYGVPPCLRSLLISCFLSRSWHLGLGHNC